MKKQLYREIKSNPGLNHKRRYNELNKHIQLMVKEYRAHKWISACEEINVKQGKEYWQQIKKLSKYKISHSKCEILNNNEIISDDKIVARLFRDHWEQIFGYSENDNFDINNKQAVQDCVQEYFSVDQHGGYGEIGEEEYFESLMSGKNTAPGNDNIHRKVLKQLNDKIHQTIIKIMNYCLLMEYFPKEWKKGTIINIPKPNTDHRNIKNYRPITLLPVIGKVFEKIIQKRLQESVGQHYIPPYQFGFKQKNSTIHPLMVLTSNTQAHQIYGQKTAVLFMDIQKAFDSVWHCGIIYKLIKIGCPRYLITIIKEFLNERTLQVRTGNQLSETLSPQQGVPQGSPLSPILFNIFCYDIHHSQRPIQAINTTSYVLQFADDTTLIAHGKSLTETLVRLQRLTDETVNWFKKWRLMANPDKSRLVIFGHRITPQSPHIVMLQNHIAPSSSARYLGIHVDNKLNFKYHLQKMKQKMINRAKHFRSLTFKNQGINIYNASRIYKMICRPIIEYGHALYTGCRPTALKIVEVAERRTLRTITKIRHPHNPLHNPSNQFLYEKTKIVPILHRFHSLVTKFVQYPHNAELIRSLIIDLEHERLRRKRKVPENTIYNKIFS